jgi:hypothetical protein
VCRQCHSKPEHRCGRRRQLTPRLVRNGVEEPIGVTQTLGEVGSAVAACTFPYIWSGGQVSFMEDPAQMAQVQPWRRTLLVMIVISLL